MRINVLGASGCGASTTGRALAERLRSVESRNVTYLSEHFPVFWEEARGANVRDVHIAAGCIHDVQPHQRRVKIVGAANTCCGTDAERLGGHVYRFPD